MAITWKGKIQVAILRFLLFWIWILKRQKWKYPIRGFEENPRYFGLKDSIYLAYKYYFSISLRAEKDSGIKSYFHKQEFNSKESASDLTISLGGDLMPYTYINGETCRNLWGECGTFFFSSDIVFANLETPVDTTRKPSLVPEVMLKEMLFNANEEIFDVFNGQRSYKGFDVLSVANNHSLDQGEEGLDQTLKFLIRKNIQYSGAALTKDALHDFPIISKKGINIAFISFTFSLNKFYLPPERDWRCNHIRLNKPGVDIDLIVEQARIARRRGAHLVIASLHMGNAYQAYPVQNTIDVLHRICTTAGIDVVVVGHAHNAQPIEWFEYNDVNLTRRKSLIFHSLGDFVAYDIYVLSHLSLLVKLYVKKIGDQVTLDGFEILPAYLLPTFNGDKISQLTFRHFDKVFSERKNYSPDIRKQLSVVRYFYKKFLFTSAQRKKIILK